MEIATKEKLIILNNKMKLWQNTYYDAGLDAKIATSIGNDQLVKQSAERMKQALQAIGWLEKEISTLEGGDKSG